MKANFQSRITKFEDSLWSFHIKVPDAIYQDFAKNKIKRVIMKIDGSRPLHSGFMPEGEGKYFLMLSKELMKSLQLVLDQKVSVEITKDDSKYGMEISEELSELLHLDPEGSSHFHSLSPGKIRSLIHYVGNFKSSDKRIEKSVIILEHLKANNGLLDWKTLHEAFKMGI